MRIGGSLLLIAIGAILKFAVHPSGNTHGFDVPTIGIILIIVGAIGLIVTAIWMFSRRRTDVVHQAGPAGSRTSYMAPNEPTDRPY